MKAYTFMYIFMHILVFIIWVLLSRKFSKIFFEYISDKRTFRVGAIFPYKGSDFKGNAKSMEEKYKNFLDKDNE